MTSTYWSFMQLQPTSADQCGPCLTQYLLEYPTIHNYTCALKVQQVPEMVIPCRDLFEQLFPKGFKNNCATDDTHAD